MLTTFLGCEASAVLVASNYFSLYVVSLLLACGVQSDVGT
jgi:hypothetical protein